MKKLLAAAIAVSVVAATPAAGAATQNDKDQFISNYLNQHLEKPKEPWATPKPLAVSDGWANEPKNPVREAWVAFVNRRGYVKPPPTPTTPSGGITFLGSALVQPAYSSPSADWDAIAACEGGGNWSLVTTGNGYYFVLQFAPGTWLAYGGTQAELDAGVAPSRSRLIQVAEAVLRGQGPGAWPNCFA